MDPGQQQQYPPMGPSEGQPSNGEFASQRLLLNKGVLWWLRVQIVLSGCAVGL